MEVTSRNNSLIASAFFVIGNGVVLTVRGLHSSTSERVATPRNQWFTSSPENRKINQLLMVTRSFVGLDF